MISKYRITSTLLAGVFGIGLSGLATAGWYAGDCAQHYANGGCGTCISYQDQNGNWWHVNGPGGLHTDPTAWNGALVSPPSPQPPYGTYVNTATTPFPFSGTADLTCGLGLSCSLTLEGNVNKDGNKVNIEIVGGQAVAGDLLCGLVDIQASPSDPWYIGPTTQHGGFGPAGGIVIGGSGPYSGNVGNISFEVANPLGSIFDPIVDLENVHVHNVIFNNNGSGASSFYFNSEFFQDGSDAGTGCTIEGELFANTYDVNIHYLACP